MNLQEPQRKAYDVYMQNMSYQQSMLWSSREEGRDKGRREEKIVIARNLLKHGATPELVAASTGLSFEDIDSLRHG